MWAATEIVLARKLVAIYTYGSVVRFTAVVSARIWGRDFERIGDSLRRVTVKIYGHFRICKIFSRKI